MSKWHEVSLEAAAAILDVSSEQARRYVQRGLLPARKIAGVWLVSAAHADGLRWGRPRPGRPLAPAAAWERIIAGDIDLDDPWRYVNRGAISRWTGTPPMIEAMLAHDDIIVSGVHASRPYGGLLAPHPTEAAVYRRRPAEPDHSSYTARGTPTRGLVPDPLGGVAIRTVPDHIWDLAKPHTIRDDATGLRAAPAAAVALDLALSPHPRERDIADRIASHLNDGAHD